MKKTNWPPFVATLVLGGFMLYLALALDSRCAQAPVVSGNGNVGIPEAARIRTPPDASALQAAPEQPAPAGGVNLAVVNPNTGEVQTATLDGDNLKEEFRAAFGMPSQIEERAAKTYLTRDEVLKYRGSKVKCRYVARYNAMAFLDAEARVWNGTTYDAGIFPVLAELPNGLVQTVEPAREDGEEHAGQYVVIYFHKKHLATDWHHTDWAMNFNNSYDAVNGVSVPELCPVPKGAKEKKTAKH
ncbi:MAG: hypothetical protein HYV42_02775 [Candidatus Magasanikbacteria bacterium]|nr:hypothetical protein [Candidatus Magasanikbacteria bacterium]